MQRTPAEQALGLDLPTRRIESFHYTDLRNALRELPEEAGLGESGKTYEPAVETYLVAFKDGQLENDPALPQGVMMTNDVTKANSSDINDAIVAMNANMSGEAVAFVITGDATVEKPLGLGHVKTQEARSGVYHKVTVKAGANASVIERHTGHEGVASLASTVSDVTVEEGAKATWFIIQQEDETATRLARLNVELAQDAELSVFVLNAGGKLVRQEINITVNGENASLNLRGVNLIDHAHIDVTTVLDHKVPNTNAEELFRNVVTGGGHGIFQGQIKVAQPAQKTDAQMACNTLLLTDDGDFSAKPELEIFADDVICAHGATVADIDEDHMFYLKARGIDEKTARALLIKAFVDEVVEELEAGETIEEALIGMIDDWLDEKL